MNENKIRVNFMIEPDVNQKLAEVAKYFKMSKSQFVNNYIDDLTTTAIMMMKEDNKTFFNSFSLKVKNLKDTLEDIISKRKVSEDDTNKKNR
jgi:hypothetical protein